MDIESQLKKTEKKIDKVLNDLNEREEGLKRKTITDENNEKIQELKTAVTAKKSILDVYSKVLDNITVKVMPVLHDNRDNMDVVESIITSTTEIIGDINKEINSTEEIIMNINNLEETL